MLTFIKSHPAGLASLFFTEMWERFSYYGMRALLVLYLVNSLELPRAEALSIYATYTGLVYLTPILGGYLADKYLGTRRAVLVGSMVMAMGHFAMAVPSLLYFALGLLVAGNGFFKPNISTMVGRLYGPDDSRRDSGFTIFYMGINLGAFFSPLVCGTLGEKLGWHYGFAAAGIGMLAGLVIFVRGQHHLAGAGIPKLLRWDWLVAAMISLLILFSVCVIVLFWSTVVLAWREMDTWMKFFLPLLVLAGLIYGPGYLQQLGQTRRIPLLMTLTAQTTVALTAVEWRRITAILIQAVFVIFFWMGFEQAGGTMNLFADKLTDRQVLGWELPASYFQSFNPLLILILAPLFSILWTRLEKSSYSLSVVSKQAIGMIILGAGFIVLAIAQQRADILGQVGPQWLLLVYLLHTIGELCLSPIGLSMVTKLAPTQLVALMMGAWFTAMAAANYLAGSLEQLIATTGIPLYWFLVGSSVGAGLLLLLLSPLINKLMHGVR